jgi:hypothetical protein
MVKAFHHGSSSGMKHGSITLTCRQTVNGMASYNFSSEEVVKVTPPAEQVKATVF